MGAYDLAMIFVRDVWKLHGLPDSIVSDRRPQFVSEFWKAVCCRLQIKLNLSTAHHYETDGQAKNSNSFMSQYIRQYVNFAQDDWDEWPPLAARVIAARPAIFPTPSYTLRFFSLANH
jgi:transposase InsO family protein